MTTTPLPPPGVNIAAGNWTAVTYCHYYTSDQMQDYDAQARADLEAENKRLREALTAVVSFWDRLNFDGSPINELHTAARDALESKP